METIFLILSGAILIAGILYWFWSHIQLTQKKVQLLENAVFELRGMLSSRISPADPIGTATTSGSPYKDLDDDDWEEEGAPVETAAAAATSSDDTVKHIVIQEREVSSTDTGVVAEKEISDDLQPGGRIELPTVEADASAAAAEDDSSTSEQFRELFVSSTAVAAAAAETPVRSGALDGMPVKDLRILAKQRGIPDAENMRKKELLSALRSTATVVETAATLDLTHAEQEVPTAD